MQKKNILFYTAILKFLLPAVFMLFVAFDSGHIVRYGIFCGCELIMLAVITNWLAAKKKSLAYVFSSVTVFLYIAQIAVLYYGRTYITTVMLVNLDSVKDLSGKAFTYLFSLAAAIVISLLPVAPVFQTKKTARLISLLLAFELFFAFFYGNAYSPFYGYCDLIIKKINSEAMKINPHDLSESAQFFYKEELPDSIEKDSSLPKHPNIIFIFTEGLSQSVIDDERNLMPNMAEFQKKAINFTNYYNHTFATYQGLIGQLYSGYQSENYDTNTLISLQGILQKHGYSTVFLNTEPNNAEFTKYLNNMDFEEVRGEKGTYTGGANSISDKDAYNWLFTEAMAMEEEEKPFFLATYTFGTHTTLDSPDDVYGDGKDPMLNKFYNVDKYFGEFMQSYSQSPLAEDTIIVLTSDHCTYNDMFFKHTFPDCYRFCTVVDRIPLNIYYKGVTPQTIDVNGRNSLDVAPTLLDIIDISDENFFLGTTLFDKTGNEFDTISREPGSIFTTAGANIAPLGEEDEKAFKDKLLKYYAAKQYDTNAERKE